jgi:hypothetical protein
LICELLAQWNCSESIAPSIFSLALLCQACADRPVECSDFLCRTNSARGPPMA